MISYRRIIPEKSSKKQPYQVILVWLFFVAIFILVDSLILFSGIIKFTKVKFYLFIFLFLLFLISISLSFVEILALKSREIVSKIKIPEMNVKSKGLSKKIRRLFNNNKIIYVLKFSNLTKYGHEMPLIYVFVNNDCTAGYVAIENIANFSKLDKSKMEQSISGILGGKYKRFSVVSSFLNNNDSYMLFNFEDTETSYRIHINNDLSEYLSSDVHSIKLSMDLKWHADVVPHISIIARTRSGKSMLAGGYMAPIMKKQGWSVEYNSAKYDRYVKSFSGKSEINEIVERAEHWCLIMKERLRVINEKNKDKYTEINNMNDIAIFFDELGNLNAGLDLDRSLKKRWEIAINKLSATGASAGIHIIAISQFGTKDGFLPSLARVNCSDAVIMLGGAADSGDERRYLMPGFADLPTRNYGVGQGIAMILGSGFKWSKPHFYETPLINQRRSR